MEYSFVAVVFVFVVVVITACAQWAVALLELRKHSATGREHEEEQEEIRVRAHLCYFNYFICAELQREEDRERESKVESEGRVKQQFSLRWLFACNLPVQIVKLTIPIRNWNVHSPQPFLSFSFPFHPLSLFALLFYLAWFYFILFSLYFISFYCLRAVQTNSALGLLMLQLIHFCFCFRFHF